MTPEEWRRIKGIATEALEQPAAARAALVAAACAGDPALQAEVEKLLESTDAAADLYETPILPGPRFRDTLEELASLGPALVGTSVGPYRIVRELGRGGMGRVFLAERADGAFDQRVAIKFVAGLPTEQLLQRFFDERRILASLDHPNIARLIDGGATADGLPYVVMEYVAGVPIDEFCNAQGSSVEARVRLFLRVCDAVQYAHERLVIHRDLKARNILVTADGTPKLLDFGIAKLVDAGPSAPEATRTMFRLITPETASPEQLRGEPVTTATDVYALGGLLYRLLTGRAPYDADAQSDAEWIRIVCEVEPVAPSRRAGWPGVAAIDRDLDLIALEALRKEPERRYSTVNRLSDDLRRYLDGRPVLAAPDGTAYRLRKFIGRHRVAVAAAVALAVAMIGGTLTTAREAQIARRERARAEGRFDDVRQLANSFMFEVHDAIQNLPGSTPARRLLITRVLEYLEKLSRDAGAETLLQLEIATAYQKVGNVQGNPYFGNIGDAAGAMQSYQKALGITEALVSREASAPNRAALAASHHLVADMFWAKGTFPEALDHYRRAVALREQLAPGDGSDERQRLELASSHYSIGQTLLRSGDYQGAVDAYARSQAIQSEVSRKNPANHLARRSFATSSAKLGDVLAVQGDHRRALEYHAQAAAILREEAATEPGNVSIARLLAITLYRVAVDQSETGDYRGATVTARQALDLQQPIVAADPSNVQVRADIASVRRILGEALLALNEPRQASQEIGEAEKTLRAILAINPNNADNAGVLAMTLLSLGDVLVKIGDLARARNAYTEVTTLLGTHSREEALRYLGVAHDHAGDVERQLARAALASSESREHERAACRHYRQGLDAFQARPRRSGDAKDAVDIGALTKKVAACGT